MSRHLKGALATLFLILMCATANSGQSSRPNKGKELYSPPWSDEVAELATSCKDLEDAECATLRRLVGMPHAYWVGLNASVHQELQDLHNVIRDALNENQVLTIILYSLPDRDCGGGVRLHERVTVDDYKLWVAKVADAVTYYKKLPINIIIEPGALSHVVTKTSEVCRNRNRKELLNERIELIRYALWNLVDQDKKRNRANPYLRLFIDVGGPDEISTPRAKLSMAKVLEQILKVAETDGISVNVGGLSSFDESIAWAKELLLLMPGDIGKKLTISVDISRSGRRVKQGCNTPGAALDERAPTLNHEDPKVELVLMVKDPSVSDGNGERCHGGRTAGDFDLSVFREYLRNTAQKQLHAMP